MGLKAAHSGGARAVVPRFLDDHELSEAPTLPQLPRVFDAGQERSFSTPAWLRSDEWQVVGRVRLNPVCRRR
jgi:hypothetical protein